MIGAAAMGGSPAGSSPAGAAGAARAVPGGCPPPAAVALVRAAVAARRPALDEWCSKQLLAAYGVPVPAGALVTSDTAAVEAAAHIGAGGRSRVALKAVGADIHHKTEHGLVLLGVPADDPRAVAGAYRLMAERAGDALEGVLVEEMVAGDREFLVGLKRDPVFGPIVAFGLGGVLTEALGDVALAVVPLSERDIAELPDLIRAKKLLGPFRGAPPVDRAVLGDIVRAIAAIAADFPEIAEIDINPLLVAGGRPVAADALAILSAAHGAPTASRPFPSDLRAVLAPDSVAIIGANEDIRKWGGSALRNILDGGYQGTIYPVNPKGGVFFGVQAYKTLAELPEAPDLALLAVGGAQVKGALADCGRRGVKAAVVLTAGFSETGVEGAEHEREILQVAVDHGMTLIGPNCMGLMSNEKRLHATGFVALHPPAGKLSFVSQSGSMGPTVINMCERRGIGMNKFISVGNEAMVSAFDVLDYLRDDPGTECVTLYLEGIDDGRHFMEAARQTTSRKPVVVLRGGLTELGGKAAASHTGALAGSAAVFQAAARQAGVVTCGTTQDLVDLGACLAYLPLPRGRRIAVITNGGGPGVLGADEVALNGLELAELTPELTAALDAILPAYWSKRNPLDLVAAGLGDIGLRALELVVRCETVDAVMSLNFLGIPSTAEAREKLANGEYEGFTAWETAVLRTTAELMEETGKPVIHVPDHPVHGSVPTAGDRFVPVVLAAPRSAAQALAKMAWYGEYRRRAGGGG
jgi:acyl-CoA synthetase (NDP forming)